MLVSDSLLPIIHMLGYEDVDRMADVEELYERDDIAEINELDLEYDFADDDDTAPTDTPSHLAVAYV